jgi:hypothetical protein
MSYRSVLANPFIAFNLNLRPAAPGYRPGNATAMLELGVSGVHYSIRMRLGDVAMDYTQFLPQG